MTLSCFELGEHMLSVEEARQALSALIEKSLPSEVIDLSQAHGRRLAQDVIAPINVPQNTNAAMDGVALAWPDTPQHQWPLIGSSLAGRAFDTRTAWGLRAYHHRCPTTARYRHGHHGRAAHRACPAPYN